MFGSSNKILEIDLDSEEVKTRVLEADLYRTFVGGSSFAARLFVDYRGYESKTLQPESPLLVMAGPMVGTNFPGTSRCVVCARSPLTGIWGESASGGSFGADLK